MGAHGAPAVNRSGRAVGWNRAHVIGFAIALTAVGALTHVAQPLRAQSGPTDAAVAAGELVIDRPTLIDLGFE